MKIVLDYRRSTASPRRIRGSGYDYRNTKEYWLSVVIYCTECLVGPTYLFPNVLRYRSQSRLQTGMDSENLNERSTGHKLNDEGKGMQKGNKNEVVAS